MKYDKKHSMDRVYAALISLVILVFPLHSHAHDVFYPTGTYFHVETDLRVAARGGPMTWERTYRSNRLVKRSDSQTHDFKRPVDGPLGFGWHTPFTVRIENGDTFVAGDGRHYTFDKDDAGNLKPDYANGFVLSAMATGFELREIGGNTSTFDSDGKLLSIKDSQGRTATLAYSGSSLIHITDTAGRTV